MQAARLILALLLLAAAAIPAAFVSPNTFQGDWNNFLRPSPIALDNPVSSAAHYPPAGAGVSPTAVPEPASMLLVGAVLLLCGLHRRRRTR